MKKENNDLVTKSVNIDATLDKFQVEELESRFEMAESGWGFDVVINLPCEVDIPGQ